MELNIVMCQMAQKVQLQLISLSLQTSYIHLSGTGFDVLPARRPRPSSLRRKKLKKDWSVY